MKPQPTDSELLAYIDGELPERDARAVAEFVAGNPSVGERLESLRNLRVVSRDVIRRDAPAVPAELLAKIGAMGDEFEAGGTKETSREPNGGVRRVAGSANRYAVPTGFWRFAAAAAVVGLLVGVPVWFALSPRAERVVLVGLSASGLPARTVSLLEARHLKCAMMGNNFEDVTFPKLLKDAGPAVRAFLGDSMAAPDLTDIGLEFAGVGPCDIPGGKTLHWLYRSNSQPGVFVSLFVQPYASQVTFPKNTAVVVAGPTEKFPILVWRSDLLVFYLIGDDFGATSAVAGRMNQSFGG